MISPIELTQELIRFETINPPGNEAPCSRYLGKILEDAGFKTSFSSIGDNRENLIATLDGDGGLPLCFSGHVDVVPLGLAPWSVDPFAADISDGKIYGRGSTDMKAGVAAFICASLEYAKTRNRKTGLVLVISAGEERGCEGANFMASHGLLPQAGAIVVAEPTANRVLVGHKGVLWLEGVATGITAHGSTPDKGVNAVYKAARAALALEAFDFTQDEHAILGRPTVNIGWLRGGLNVNSVPDEARMGIDIRLVPGVNVDDLLTRFRGAVGDDITFNVLGTSEPVWSEPSDAWIQSVVQITQKVTGRPETVGGATYFTDAAALKPAMGEPPTIILGPGEPELAHQTDEYCFIDKIEQATAIYAELIESYMDRSSKSV